ncbi:MAG: 4a-hydroxytetrahydrobiopterin dehydratase, partial [Planctomycetota bacterium]
MAETKQTEKLAEKKCVPCAGGTAPLKGEKLAACREHLSDWDVIEEHHLVRTFRFDDFNGALGFVNR